MCRQVRPWLPHAHDSLFSWLQLYDSVLFVCAHEAPILALGRFDQQSLTVTSRFLATILLPVAANVSWPAQATALMSLPT